MGGREKKQRRGRARLSQGLSLCLELFQTILKSSGGGREPWAVVHSAIYEAFPLLWGQSCDHMNLCFSKLHVCFCSFCQTKSVQLVATYKESGLAQTVSKFDFFPRTSTNICIGFTCPVIKSSNYSNLCHITVN